MKRKNSGKKDTKGKHSVSKKAKSEIEPTNSDKEENARTSPISEDDSVLKSMKSDESMHNISLCYKVLEDIFKYCSECDSDFVGGCPKHCSEHDPCIFLSLMRRYEIVLNSFEGNEKTKEHSFRKSKGYDLTGSYQCFSCNYINEKYGLFIEHLSACLSGIPAFKVVSTSSTSCNPETSTSQDSESIKIKPEGSNVATPVVLPKSLMDVISGGQILPSKAGQIVIKSDSVDMKSINELVKSGKLKVQLKTDTKTPVNNSSQFFKTQNLKSKLSTDIVCPECKKSMSKKELMSHVCPALVNKNKDSSILKLSDREFDDVITGRVQYFKSAMNNYFNTPKYKQLSIDKEVFSSLEVQDDSVVKDDEKVENLSQLGLGKIEDGSFDVIKALEMGTFDQIIKTEPKEEDSNEGNSNSNEVNSFRLYEVEKMNKLIKTDKELSSLPSCKFCGRFFKNYGGRASHEKMCTGIYAPSSTLIEPATHSGLDLRYSNPNGSKEVMDKLYVHKCKKCNWRFHCKPNLEKHEKTCPG